MVTENKPWLLKEAIAFLDVKQPSKDYYFYASDAVNVRHGSSNNSSAKELAFDAGQLYFLPDDSENAILYRTTDQDCVLELQLISTREINSLTPSLICFHFAAPILPSVCFITGEAKTLVCWVGLVSGEVYRLVFDAPNYFYDRRWGLFRSQKFILKNTDTDVQLVLFKALDTSTVVVATSSGLLFYGKICDNQSSMEVKEWVQPSLFSELISSFYRLAPSMRNGVSQPNSVASSFQTISLASFPIQNHHLVVSLCRDRNLRLWSTKTHQLIWTHPLSNFTLDDIACEMPSAPLSSKPANVLRVHIDPKNPQKIYILVYSLTDAGATFLVYSLTLNSQQLPIQFDLSFWLVYRRGLTDTSNIPDLQDMALQFTCPENLNSSDVPQLWAIWKQNNISFIEYISLQIYGNVGGTGYPFHNIGERWLPVAPLYSKHITSIKMDSALDLNEAKTIFKKIVYLPYNYSLKVLRQGLKIFLSDSDERFYYQDFSIEEMVDHFLIHLEKKSTLIENYKSELQKFLHLCDAIRSKYRQPIALAISPKSKNVFVVYGDGLGSLRACNFYEILTGLVSDQIPHWAEYIALSPLLNRISNLSFESIPLLISVFRTAQSLWLSGYFEEFQNSLDYVERDPGSVSVLNLLSDNLTPILSRLKAGPMANQILNLCSEVLHVQSILNKLTDMVSNCPNIQFPIEGAQIVSHDHACGNYFENALLASTIEQISRCKFEIAKCLVLVQAISAITAFGFQDSVQIQPDDLVLVNNVFKAYQYSACSTRLACTTNLAFNQKNTADNLGLHQDTSFDICTTQFPLLKDDRILYANAVHGFLAAITRSPNSDSDMSLFAEHLLFKMSPGSPETQTLFYPLLTWLEKNLYFDCAFHQVSKLPLSPEQQFLFGRIMIKRGDFDKAHQYFTNALLHISGFRKSNINAEHPLRFLLPETILAGNSIDYIHYIAGWFQAYNAPSIAQLLCQQALVELNNTESSPTTKEQQSRLWQLSFDAFIATEQFSEAYYAINRLPDTFNRYPMIRLLVTKMCEQGKIKEFCRFSFSTLNTVVEAVLWDLIGSMTFDSINKNNYFEVLNTYHFSRNEPYGMAMVQYHYVLWLSSHKDLPEDLLSYFLELQIVNSRLSASNLSSCVDQMVLKTRSEFKADKLRLSPLFGPSLVPDELVTEVMLVRLNTLLIVQQNLASLFPHQGLLRNPAPINKTIDLLLESQQFEAALRVLSVFDIDLMPAIRGLTLAYINDFNKITENSSNLASEFDMEMDDNPNPWAQLESALIQYKHPKQPGAYVLEAISVLLESGFGKNKDRVIPSWLLSQATKQNQSGLIRILLLHDQIDTAHDIITEFLNQQLDDSSNVSSSRPFLPVNLVDKIIQKLESSQDPRLKTLQSLVSRYLELNSANV